MLYATVHDQVAAGPYPVWDRAAALSPSLLVLGCSSEPSLPGPCCHFPKLWPPRFQVMAPTPHCPADLLLLWAPLPRSWHPALVGHHWRYAAAVLHLPSGARVGTLTCCPKAVLLLHPPSEPKTPLHLVIPRTMALLHPPKPESLQQVLETKVLVPWQICKHLHLWHWCHCYSKYTCAPQARHMCLILGSQLASAVSTSMSDQMPRWIF